jgi:hypothetical protein
MPSRSAFATLAAILILILISTSTLPAAAQIRAGGTTTAGFGISAGSNVHGMRAGHFHQGNAAGRRSLLLPYPYFYSDSDYDAEGAQPQVVVVQASAPAPQAPPVPPAPRESLLIEWQGDRFVRTTASAKAETGPQIAPDYSEQSSLLLASPARAVSGQSASGQFVSAQKATLQPPHGLPPAVLVFHDGRKEEVSEYTIMSGTIYSKADYWTTGSWTKKIQIADLDVPATMKLNEERGLKFVLPASPNEVVIRP